MTHLVLLCFVVRPQEPLPKPSVQHQIVHLTNLERRKEGLVPLQMSDGLMKAAQGHAEDMSDQNYFSHKGRDGSRFDQRCLRAGYKGSPRGENIAMGAPKPDHIVEMWMESAGHRANILAQDLTEIGVGFASPGAYSVMCLGASDREIPVVIENEAPSADKAKVLVYFGGRKWARQMRFCTDGRTFGAWQPHATFAHVELPPHRGHQTLIVEFEGPRGARRSASDSIFLDLPPQEQEEL